MNRLVRHGFTLVELLVVITIIGMLMGLLLPAVNAARENARRADCQNNIKQIGLGTLQYEMVNKSFPGFRNPPLCQEPVSWVQMLFPFLDRNDVYLQLKKGVDPSGNGTFVGLYMKLFLCSSNPPDSADTSSTPLAYVCNSGRFNNYPRQACDGVFLDQIPSQSSPANPVPVKVPLAYIVTKDGTSTTLMYSERLYYFPATTSPPTPDQGNYRIFPGETPAVSEGRVAFSWTTSTTAKVSDHVSSRHGSGANVSYCDNRVKFLSDSCNYDVYRQLMTPSGIDAGVTRMISDTDIP